MSQIIEAAKCGEVECVFKWASVFQIERAPEAFRADCHTCSGPKCAKWVRLIPHGIPGPTFIEAATLEEQEQSTHGRCGLSTR